MRLRLKSVLATLVATGMLAGMLGFAQVAHAAAPVPPPYEPDPGARGCLTFYDVNGNVVRSGNTSTSPPFAFALGNGPVRAGDNLGTLYIAQPEPGQPSNAWLTDVISAGNAFPSTGSPTPASLRNRPEPLYIGAAGEATLATEQTVLPHPPADTGTPYQGVYQIRFITNGVSSGTDPLWWRADIQISGNTWTQTWCPPP